MGPESLTFARTTEIDSFQPPGPSRPASAEPAGRDQGAPGQDAETPNSKQSATFGRSLPGYERDREERIRRDHLRRRDKCPRVPKEAPSHRQPHSGDANQRRCQPFREKPPFLELHAVKTSGRYHQALQEFLQHTSVANNALVADTEVDEALGPFFNEKYRPEYSS